jgi:hypothetical protein
MIKTEIVEEKKKDEEIKYPCLMKSNYSGNIVLFIESEKGICLNKWDFKISFFDKEFFMWDMRNFKPFNGTISLSNDNNFNNQ